MKCPSCTNPLTTMTAGKTDVDVCKNGCGGIWFDRFELKKFDEPFESAGEVLLSIKRDPKVVIQSNVRRNCPRDATPMMRHFFSVEKGVTVDECPKCAGFWLDSGELADIRTEYGSEKERKRAAEAYFSHLFDGKLSEMRSAGQAEAERARKIAHMFRLICPSYWIPGKQDGAAY